jgi:hypothetical protein
MIKPSVWVQIDPDDEILKGDSVSQRVCNYLWSTVIFDIVLLRL